MHMRELGISVCAVLLGALQLEAAALNVIQAYEGPAQPASAVVRLYLARGAEIHQIDGHLVAANPFVDVVELLPGHHELRVGYKEGGVNAYGLVLSDKQYSSTEGAQVAFDAAAGSERDRLQRQIKVGVKIGKALAAGKRAHLSYRECDSKVIVFAEK